MKHKTTISGETINKGNNRVLYSKHLPCFSFSLSILLFVYAVGFFYISFLIQRHVDIRGFHRTHRFNRFLILQTSMKTSKKYWAIAAVTTQTLAIGYWPDAGIDLIDLSGRILRQLSEALYLHNLLLYSF